MERYRTMLFSRDRDEKVAVNLGFHHVLVHNVNLEKWCIKYELEQFVADCMDCGRQMHVNLPFAGKNRRGIRAKQCTCGNVHVPYVYVDTVFDGMNLNSLGKSTESSMIQGFQEKTRQTHPVLKLVDTSNF